MYKILIIVTMLCIFSSAQTLVVDYRVEFGIVGEVAKVHSIFTQNKTSYQIDIYVETVGLLAKLATHNLKEHHLCKGSINKEGYYMTHTFEMLKHYGEYRSRTLYKTNHKTKKVQKTYQKWLLQKKHKERKIQDYTYTLNYYAKDDLVTLFLNLGEHLQDKVTPNHYKFKAIGEDRQKGRVDITIPNSTSKKEMLSLLGVPHTGEWLVNVLMHRQIYNSKQGEVMVRMGTDRLIQKAVLKDILLYGDVRIMRR